MTRLTHSQGNLSQRRRNTLERVDDMSAKDTTVSGRTLFVGLGEILYDIKFPVGFSTKPIFHPGAELDAGFSPVSTQFPTLGAFVVAWDVKNKVEGAFDGYYVGCTVALTITGSTGQQSWFHWSFRGTAIRNPVILGGQVDDVL